MQIEPYVASTGRLALEHVLHVTLFPFPIVPGYRSSLHIRGLPIRDTGGQNHHHYHWEAAYPLHSLQSSCGILHATCIAVDSGWWLLFHNTLGCQSIGMVYFHELLLLRFSNLGATSLVAFYC